MPATTHQPERNPFHIDNLSDEQRAVVEAVAKDGHNAVVNAVAGSGKTRTALTTASTWLALTHYQSPVLLVAYNKRLQLDMLTQRKMMSSCDARNIEILTIHGLCGKAYGRTGMIDDGVLVRITHNKKNPKKLFEFGLVIIDEAQDLTPILFNFLHFFINVGILGRPQLLVLGDPFQLLYRFKDADESYILHADQNFQDVCAGVPFKYFRLSICFRISHEMAAWINTNLNPNNLCHARLPKQSDVSALEWWKRHGNQIRDWWGDGIHADPARPLEPNSIQYIQGSFNEVWHVKNMIKKVFGEYGTEHSVILSPYITKNEMCPVRFITNRLTTINGKEQSWLIDESYEDTFTTRASQTREHVRKNKRIVSTIHKFKGCERDAVVLVGLDRFGERLEKCDPRSLFNMFYVGATRARRKLLIIQWCDAPYVTHVLRRSKQCEIDQKDNFTRTHYEVTRLLEYCPYDPVLCAEPNDTKACLQISETMISAKLSANPCLSGEDHIVKGIDVVMRRPTLEDVSAIIGVAVEVSLQLLLDNGRLAVPEFRPEKTLECNVPPTLITYFDRIEKEKIDKRSYNWGEKLEAATAFITAEDHMYFRWRQIGEFQQWPIATAASYKMDTVQRNLVSMLYTSFGKHDGIMSSEEAPFEQQLETLKKLRHAKRLLLNELTLTFDMSKNEKFAYQYANNLVGKPDVVLISNDHTQTAKIEDMEKGCYAVVDDVTIIEIKTTTTTSHTHALQVACYGAMWKETSQQKNPTNNSQVPIIDLTSDESDEEMEVEEATEADKHLDVRMPNMYVLYPNLGILRKVKLAMDSYEFLHRLGCRKVNLPFDERRFSRPQKIRPKNFVEYVDQKIQSSFNPYKSKFNQFSSKVIDLDEKMPSKEISLGDSRNHHEKSGSSREFQQVECERSDSFRPLQKYCEETMTVEGMITEDELNGDSLQSGCLVSRLTPEEEQNEKHIQKTEPLTYMQDRIKRTILEILDQEISQRRNEKHHISDASSQVSQENIVEQEFVADCDVIMADKISSYSSL